MRTRKLTEKLISLRTQVGVTLHAYTVTTGPTGRADDEAMSNQLCAIADARGWSYLPMLLMTTLTTGGEIVRQILLEQSAEDTETIGKVLNGREKYGQTVFAVPTGCPDDEKLMALH